MDVEQDAPICTGGPLPEFGEFSEHAPTPMEEDWMWSDVYRCPVCRRVIEVGDQS